MAKLAPPTLAHRIAHDLLLLGETGSATTAEELARVQTLRRFLSGVAEVNGAFHALPTPLGVSLYNPIVCPLSPRQILSQKIPHDGQAPAYSFPLPGQPVMFLGVPPDASVPDGSRYDRATHRWVWEDIRIVADSPAGPVLLTVDSGEFEAREAPARWPVLDEVDDLLADVAQKLTPKNDEPVAGGGTHG